MLGAGMMGAGIANVAAQAGIEVMLLDRDMAAAEKGKAHVPSSMAKRIGKGMTPEKMAEALARITPDRRCRGLKGCDFVIEAVFEDPGIKARDHQARRSRAGRGHDLRLEHLHPADHRPRAELVEAGEFHRHPLLLAGREDDAGRDHPGQADRRPRAIAKALDFVAQIRKTPIVVNDSRGFYTSRCFGTYVQEGTQMLAEGINPALIENVGKQLGMPVGPLAVSDEVSIELGDKITKATKAALGEAYRGTAADDVAAHMVEIGRLGRKNGKGYYDYPERRQESALARLWPANIR